MPKLRSTYDGRLIIKTSYEEIKFFLRWAACKSAPRSRQITTPAPHHSVFYRPDALPAVQPTYIHRK